MKKVLIISSGFLPFTNSNGAIENLVNIYLKYNDKISNHDEIYLYTPQRFKNNCEIDNYNNSTFIVIQLYKKYQKVINKIMRFFYKCFKIGAPNLFIYKVVRDFSKHYNGFFDIIIFENGHNYIEYFNRKINDKSKKVLHLHNDYLNKYTKNANEILQGFDEVWTVSKYLEKQVRSISNTAKIYTVYNTIDFSNFVNRKESYIRNKYFINL